MMLELDPVSIFPLQHNVRLVSRGRGRDIARQSGKGASLAVAVCLVSPTPPPPNPPPPRPPLKEWMSKACLLSSMALFSIPVAVILFPPGPQQVESCVQQAPSRALPPSGLWPQPIQWGIPFCLLSFDLVDCTCSLPLLFLRVLLPFLIVSSTFYKLIIFYYKFF